MKCGIDPGITGAIAFVCETEHVFDMPVRIVDGKKVVDSLELYNLLYKFRPDTINCERVHSMPRQSSQSSFTFGKNYQAVISAAMFYGKEVNFINPEVWMRYFSIAGKTKSGLQAETVVKQIFPKADIYGPKGGLKDGRVDALLIAEFPVG